MKPIDSLDFSKIKAFAFDVDGVFTDGSILCTITGELYRTFDAKDGFAVRMAAMNGYPVGIITGGRSESIRARFITSGLKPEDVFLGSRNKMEDLDIFCKRYNLSPSEIIYMGDDIPDMDVMRACGYGVCPCDAVQETKDVADGITARPGGKGAVREVIEAVLKIQGKWDFDVREYKARF